MAASTLTIEQDADARQAAQRKGALAAQLPARRRAERDGAICHRLPEGVGALEPGAHRRGQLVWIAAAALAGHFAHTRGRKPTFLVAFAVLPLRGFLYTLSDRPLALIAVQTLDGIGAGIFGVVSVLMIADLTRGSGRFNSAQGAISTAQGCGAFVSNLMTGAIVRRFGFHAGFYTLTAIALVALVLFATAMPETRVRPNDDADEHDQDHDAGATEPGATPAY